MPLFLLWMKNVIRLIHYRIILQEIFLIEKRTIFCFKETNIRCIKLDLSSSIKSLTSQRYYGQIHFINFSWPLKTVSGSIAFSYIIFHFLLFSLFFLISPFFFRFIFCFRVILFKSERVTRPILTASNISFRRVKISITQFLRVTWNYHRVKLII